MNHLTVFLMNPYIPASGSLFNREPSVLCHRPRRASKRFLFLRSSNILCKSLASPNSSPEPGPW